MVYLTSPLGYPFAPEPGSSSSFVFYGQCAKVLRVGRYDLNGVQPCSSLELCAGCPWIICLQCNADDYQRPVYPAEVCDQPSETIDPFNPYLTSCLFGEEPRSRIMIAMATANKKDPVSLCDKFKLQINGFVAVAC